MLKTYFLVALRILRRNKAYSLLNILGLSIGVAASVLIFLVIHWETGYDGYHKNKDRVYRLVTELVGKSNGEVVEAHGFAPVGLGDVVRKEVAGVAVAAVMKYSAWQAHLSAKGMPDQKRLLQKEVMVAEPELFDMLDVEWLEGNASGLEEPGTAVIAASVGDKWFGSWKYAVGKVVEMGSARRSMKITGVFKDLPGNTDIPLELVPSYATMRRTNPDYFTYPDRWHYAAKGLEVFVMLTAGEERSRVESRLADIVDRYYGEQKTEYKTRSRLELQPLTSMHLDERFETFKGDALSRKVLWSLGAIGVLLLVVACINFINLSTAQSVKRSKEVGVRKLLGSNRWELMRQFILETGVIVIAAVVLGAVLAQLSLPWLDRVMGKPVAADWLGSPTLPLFLLLTAVAIVLLAGFYPAVVLSGFAVVDAIKSRISTSTIGGLSLRRSLVVVQFVIAQLLITGTIVVVKQLQFFRTRPMGFEQNAVALLELPSSPSDVPRQDYLKRLLLEVPGVEAASLSNEGAAGGIWWRQQAVFFDHSPVAQDFRVEVQVADPDFAKTMRIPLLAGVLPDTARSEVMVNETMVKRLGLRSPLEAIGKSLALGNDSNLYRVVGVVRDYHHQSLREAIGPVVIQPEDGGYNFLTIRMQAGALQATTDRVQKAFASVYPDYLFDCRWLDERIAQFYKTEETTAQLVRVFAALAILISCFGLYGLVAFLAVQKTKEVGIRKVLGASVGSILLLFSREFTLLTGLAFLIAAPLGYAVMQHWLNGFYYHVTLGWGVFAITLGSSLAIAWLTVGYKALLAALVSPASSLKG